MRSAHELVLVVRVELGQQQAGVADRIDADIVSAAVGGAPTDDDFDPGEPAVRGSDGETGRLGDDRRPGAYAAPEQLVGPETLELLIGDRRDENVAGDAGIGRA